MLLHASERKDLDRVARASGLTASDALRQMIRTAAEGLASEKKVRQMRRAAAEGLVEGLVAKKEDSRGTR